MQRRLLRFGAFLILMLFTWGHLSELFDQWDNTFETGNDIEYSVVFLALVAGAAIVVSRAVVLVRRTASKTVFPLPLVTALQLATHNPANFIGHSPPLSLRI